MSDIRRILVAVKDPWAQSLPAMEKAAQLARALGANITLFHAMSEPFYIDVSQANEATAEKRARQTLDRTLRGTNIPQARRQMVARHPLSWAPSPARASSDWPSATPPSGSLTISNAMCSS